MGILALFDLGTFGYPWPFGFFYVIHAVFAGLALTAFAHLVRDRELRIALGIALAVLWRFGWTGLKAFLTMLAAIGAEYHMPETFLDIPDYHLNLLAILGQMLFDEGRFPNVAAFVLSLVGFSLIISKYRKTGVRKRSAQTLLGLVGGTCLGFLTFGASWIFSIMQAIGRRRLREGTEMKLRHGIAVYEDSEAGIAKLHEELLKEDKNGVEIYPGLNVPWIYEAANTIVAGGMSSGKTVFLRRILKQTRARGDRNVIVDVKGEYSEMFAGENETILLGVVDARSVPWDVASDIATELEAQEFAQMLVPESGPGDKNSFFSEAARDCITGAIVYLQRERKNAWNFPDLAKILGDKDLLFEALQRYRPGALQLLMDKENKNGGQQSAGVFGNIRAKTQLLDYFAQAWPTSEGGFSVKTWVRSETGAKRLLLIRYVTRYKVVSGFFASMIVELLLKELISLPDNPGRRVNMFLDELSTYQYLPSLSEAVKVSRSKGFPIYAAIQEVATLNATYKQEGGIDNVLNGFGIKLIGRQDSHAAAKHWSDSFGESVFEKITRTKSRDTKTRSLSFSEKREDVREPALPTGKLLEMPYASKDSGATLYLRMPGTSLVKLVWDIEPCEKPYEGFVAADWVENLKPQLEAAAPAAEPEPQATEAPTPESPAPAPTPFTVNFRQPGTTSP